MKIPLELNVVEDGRIFLNFWDFNRGHDVVAELKQGQLYLDEGDYQSLISIEQFAEMVRNRFSI